jgi:uncharacterized alkaline shock family protein YloU
MADQRWERLPCGRDKERLLEIVADERVIGPSSHEATCPYCQAALNEFRSLWVSVRQWSNRPTKVPSHLVSTIIARVRRMTQSPHHVVASTARGVTSVTSWVIGLVGTEVALRVAGVAEVGPPHARGRWNRRAEVRHGADSVQVTEVGAAAVSLDLVLAVRPTESILQLAEAVRAEVIGELRRLADLEVAEVNLSVGDIDLA